MGKVQSKGEVIAIKTLLESDADFIHASVKAAIEAALEAEMAEALGAAKGEQTETRLGYRGGYYQRSLITRVGTLELRVPQDRAGRFSTELMPSPAAPPVPSQGIRSCASPRTYLALDLARGDVHYSPRVEDD